MNYYYFYPNYQYYQGYFNYANPFYNYYPLASQYLFLNYCQRVRAPAQLFNNNASKNVPKSLAKRLHSNNIDPAIYIVHKNAQTNNGLKTENEKIKGGAIDSDTSFSDKSIPELKILVDKKTKSPMPTRKLSPKLKSPIKKALPKSPSKTKTIPKNISTSNSKNLFKTPNSSGVNVVPKLNKCCRRDSSDLKAAKSPVKKPTSPVKKNSDSDKNRPKKAKTYLKLILSDPNSSKPNLKPKLIAKTNSSKISSPNKSPILKTIYRIDSKGYIHKI